jgi:hypothetical protein
MEELNPMESALERTRRDWEVERYPQLDFFLVWRPTATQNHYMGLWMQEMEKLDGFERTESLNDIVLHGKFHDVPDIFSLSNSRFKSIDDMISWIYRSADKSLLDPILHTQCCMLGLFCHCVERSIENISVHSKRRMWLLLFNVFRCVVCREGRWPWGQEHSLFRFVRDRLSEARDYALFCLPGETRALAQTQVADVSSFANSPRQLRRRTIEERDAKNGV